jgi:hypothetical protein
MLYSRSKIPHLNSGVGFSKGFFHGQKIPHLNLGEGFYKCFIHGQKSLN